MAHSVSAKKTAPTELGSETFSYVIRKMKPIFPIYVFAAIFELLIHVLLRTNMPTHIQYRIWDLLFLRAAGLGNGNISAVGGGWYLSAMFFGCWICYPLLRKWPDVMMHIVAPSIAIFVFGWFEITHGHINFALTMQNGVCLRLLRGISEMCAGVFSYALCEKLKHITPEKPLVWITAAELIFYGYCFCNHNPPQEKQDGLYRNCCSLCWHYYII